MRSDTRTQILDVAQDLVQRLGSNGMSYQDISKAVGIRKASIHYYFPNKEDLLKALIERYSVAFLAMVDAILASKQTPMQKLDAYIDLFEGTMRAGKHDKACLCGVLGAELASLDRMASRGVRDFYEANEQRLATILKEGRASGAFRFKGTDRATAALIFSLLEGAVLIARAQDGVPQFRAIANQLKALLQA